ncbi:hypothetical protein SAMN02745174_02571 [Cetobacterium ceti]|uniref:Ribbon-helix-helix domain-containing protein n=1 Tax=Cetobacterium ceti TaxID=180163 RepID=A0A1T4R5H0_9FUSO|nr:hypothetical protein [Cetobacterium ceti]SKA10911.1 hypothetical protein SAMN02745174_02571 [Cetobacterium ceti]
MAKGGKREGAGRKEGSKTGINKISKTMRIDKNLLEELETINIDSTFISKIEEGIELYIKKYKGE